MVEFSDVRERIADRAAEYECPFLDAAVDILLDPWGIPHIRAQSLRDLFFAQGFNAARDRLWQIDLWRKRGLGLLSRDFGPGFLEQDEAARLFIYRGDMEREWLGYGENARDICTWFVAGINAFVAMTRRQPELLPPEFAVMRTVPDLWLPEDVVRIRSHSLSRNALSEILRSQVLAKANAEVEAWNRDFGRAVWLGVPRPPIDPWAASRAEVRAGTLYVDGRPAPAGLLVVNDFGAQIALEGEVVARPRPGLEARARPGGTARRLPHPRPLLGRLVEREPPLRGLA